MSQVLRGLPGSSCKKAAFSVQKAQAGKNPSLLLSPFYNGQHIPNPPPQPRALVKLLTPLLVKKV